MSGISDFRPQEKNANKHTERGLALLEKSIQEDGFIGAITATADGEVIAGSARLEKVADILPADPIVIETDGTRPIIVRRTDIPNAKDVRARRLSIADNRIAQIDLEWNPEVFSHFQDAIDTYFSELEKNEILLQSEPDFSRPDINDKTSDRPKPDEKWFCVVFHGDAKRYEELLAVLKTVGKSKHEIDKDYFYALVMEKREDEIGT